MRLSVDEDTRDAMARHRYRAATPACRIQFDAVARSILKVRGEHGKYKSCDDCSAHIPDDEPEVSPPLDCNATAASTAASLLPAMLCTAAYQPSEMMCLTFIQTTQTVQCTTWSHVQCIVVFLCSAVHFGCAFRPSTSLWTQQQHAVCSQNTLQLHLL